MFCELWFDVSQYDVGMWEFHSFQKWLYTIFRNRNNNLYVIEMLLLAARNITICQNICLQCPEKCTIQLQTVIAKNVLWFTYDPLICWNFAGALLVWDICLLIIILKFSKTYYDLPKYVIYIYIYMNMYNRVTPNTRLNSNIVLEDLGIFLKLNVH